MRRSTQLGDKQNGSKRNILSNAAYSIFQSSETRDAGSAGAGGTTSSSNRRVSYVRETSSGGSSFLQRSISADNVVVRQRGFKPSDRHDPTKRNFLENLTSKILHFDMESGHSTPINLQKLLTPASDSNELLHMKNKKMYASSYFYAPSHPTVEDQVELARRISSSLSDVKNVKSKGQSMYVNRKKRSVKWIHDGNGAEEDEEPSSPVHKDKVPLKCMMNPGGKVLDIQGIQALGEESNIQTIPQNPERLFDIVRDLNNQKGRGAEIFAKRRKRSEKWVVDTEQPQSPSSYGYGKAPIYPMKQDIGANENSKFDSKPFYNPFTVDISMDYSAPPASCSHLQPQQHQCSRGSFSSAHSDCGASCHTEIKKIYLREVAVGTEPDSSNGHCKMEKSPRRLSFDGSRGSYRSSCGSSVSNGYSRGARNKMANGNHHHHYQPGNYQPYVPRSNGYSYLNGQNHNGHSHHHYHSQYHNGNGYHQPNGGVYMPNHGYQNGNGYPNGNGYQNANGYQNGHGYQNVAAYQNGNGYSNGAGYQNGYQNSSNGYQQQQQEPSNGNSEEMEGTPQEDYTPVPVKQLIQEFEKTCRPVMQYKQYAPRAIPPISNNQNDISRYFESRREVIYQQQQQQQQPQQAAAQRNQYRGGNGYAASSGDDEDDDDDDESLDDSLSPVDFYRIDDRRLLSIQQQQQVTSVNGNRSSSMSTIDEYCRRQQLQSFEDPGAKKYNEDVPAGLAALAGVALQEDILAQKKQLAKTPVLENLVAGTTTPECFKKEFTEEVAGKLYENQGYHGPKIAGYHNLNNYNTAPRGWSQTQQVYRPVKFEKPQDTKIVYSDF